MYEEKKCFNGTNYRFSFGITIDDLANGINNVIVVKRDFNIYNFDKESLYSLNLKETVDDIVSLINRDLKSKSRTYTWYNYDANYPTQEFTELKDEKSQLNFKFTFYDRDKIIIEKIWSGDFYPFNVRNSVDLTNKKFKGDSLKNIEMNFAMRIAQKASSDKQDLTAIIIKQLSSICASVKDGDNKIITRAKIDDLILEDIVINKKYKNGFIKVRDTTSPIKANQKESIYDNYETKYAVDGKIYDLSIV